MGCLWMDQEKAEKLKVDLDDLCTDLWHLCQMLLAAARLSENIRRRLLLDLGEVRQETENFPRSAN